ncbi:hypothetical protein MZM54_00985 [[Brevibacterium] frigoritolerans]|nr:hypothetical protein [Peribacillus frigoritolerans]
MAKKELIAELEQLSREGIKKTDLYMFDFIKFINEEVAPHITVEGLKILKKEYQSWIDNNDTSYY